MDTPVLHQLKFSHFNEKARFALDYKGVAHVRRTVFPGQHRDVARELAGTSTLPILVLDGRAVPDSTQIIAALEELRPEPPLYPSDPEDRRRALELEDHFDEHLGPASRRIVMSELAGDVDLMIEAFSNENEQVRDGIRAGFPAISAQLVETFGLSDSRLEQDLATLRDAGELAARTRGDSDYLVADRFTVADLTLAALVYPLAHPPQAPYGRPSLPRGTAACEAAGLAEWTREIYARHRAPSAAVEAAPA